MKLSKLVFGLVLLVIASFTSCTKDGVSCAKCEGGSQMVIINHRITPITVTTVGWTQPELVFEIPGFGRAYAPARTPCVTDDGKEWMNHPTILESCAVMDIY